MRKQSFDLVVLDAMLPGEDGFSICRRLRASSTIPIVMLTALGDDINRIVGIELGADDYVTKPFHPRELMARIKGLFGGARPMAPISPRSRPRCSSRDGRSIRFCGNSSIRKACTFR